MPISFIDINNWNIPNNIQYADEHFNVPGNIDLLIGSEIYLHLLKKGQIHNGEHFPAIQETKLGWIVASRVPPSKSYDSHREFVTSLVLSSIEKSLQKFWEVEEINTTTRSNEEEACETHFKENFYRDNHGQFVVRLPQKKGHPPLGNSLANAEHRS